MVPAQRSSGRESVPRSAGILLPEAQARDSDPGVTANLNAEGASSTAGGAERGGPGPGPRRRASVRAPDDPDRRRSACGVATGSVAARASLSLADASHSGG